MNFQSNLRAVKKFDLEHLIIDVPDYPQPGILFKDITPLLASETAFQFCIEEMFKEFAPHKRSITGIIGIEARGFIFGAALALKEQIPFIPIRKPGKLPRPSYSITYQLEYGSDSLHVHQDALQRGGGYLIVDDVLATGGTAMATAQLLTEHHCSVIGFSFALEIGQLNGRSRIQSSYPEATIAAVVSA